MALLKVEHTASMYAINVQPNTKTMNKLNERRIKRLSVEDSDRIDYKTTTADIREFLNTDKSITPSKLFGRG